MIDVQKIQYTGRDKSGERVFEILNTYDLSTAEFYEPTIANYQDYKQLLGIVPTQFEEFLFCFSRVQLSGIYIFDGVQSAEYSKNNLPQNYVCFAKVLNNYFACFDKEKKDEKVYILDKFSFQKVEEYDCFWDWLVGTILSCYKKRDLTKNTNVSNQVVQDCEQEELPQQDYEQEKNEPLQVEEDLEELQEQIQDILSSCQCDNELEQSTTYNNVIFDEYQDVLPQEYIAFAFMYNGGYLGDIYFWKLEEIDRLSQNYSFLSKDYFAFASMEGVEVYYLSLLDGKVYAYNFEDKEENCIADNFLDWLQEIVL